MTRRILVVDDDRQMAQTLCDVLQLHGWQTEGVNSGSQAIDAIKQQRYDLVLMDIRMPGLNGVAAFKAMKAHQPGVRVVLMTAYSASDLLEEAQREGALKILAKPVDLPGLVTFLEDTAEQQPILVVDDDASFLRTLSDVLRNEGYAALEARSLDEALHRLEDGNPGVVVLDLHLDHLDPEESVVAIKRVSPAVILILYSGHPGTIDQTVAAVPSEWVYACLRKPFRVEQLLTLLDDALGD